MVIIPVVFERTEFGSRGSSDPTVKDLAPQVLHCPRDVVSLRSARSALSCAKAGRWRPTRHTSVSSFFLSCFQGDCSTLLVQHIQRSDMGVVTLFHSHVGTKLVTLFEHAFLLSASSTYILISSICCFLLATPNLSSTSQYIPTAGIRFISGCSLTYSSD